MQYCFHVFFALFFCSAALAQNHDHIWQHGALSGFEPENYNHFAIDFNEEPPVAYSEDRDLNMFATMASVCDSIGNLLFYTNGMSIANFEHEIIMNGDSLNPGDHFDAYYSQGYFLVQSEVILPMPGHPDLYYLFHLRASYTDLGLARNTLYYSLIDMSSNGGAGEALSKNQVILDVTDERRFGILSAVKHANGRDWWIWVTEHGFNNYFYFLLTPEGLQGPFEASMEPEFDVYTLGKIIFSPDGTKMGRYETEHGLYIFDFDRCSGTLSGDPVFIDLPETSLGGGLAFSPDSRFAYISASNSLVFQFDLWADDIAASLDTVAVYDGYMSPVWTTFFLMQNGPDGRIYIGNTNVNDVLHYIDQPNKKGAACNVVQHGLQLPFRNRYTLPHFPNYRLGPLDGSPCDTLGLNNMPIAKYRYEEDSTDFLQVEFTDLSYYEPAEWHWDFGDNETSDEKYPVHVFPGAGEYEVCLTVSNVNGSHTFCKTLVFATVATGETLPEVGINVFPNPARGRASVILSGNYLPKAGSITLYDSMGRVHLAQSIYSGMNSVGLEGLPPGIYFYEVKDGAVKLGSGKLVVER